MNSVVMRGQQMLAKLIPISTLLALLLLFSHFGASDRPMEHQCIHDTEKMQTLIYGPIMDNETGLRHGFTPKGILERTAPQQYRPMPPSNASLEVHRAFHATAVGNIRIVTSTLDLDDPTKYCTKVDDVVSDFQGSSVKCTDVVIFTAAKKDILLNKVLPPAMGMLSGALKVKQVVGNLGSPGCDHHTVPSWHSTSGVPDADYVLYVSAAPTDGDTVAWAGLCYLDTADRPVIGMANFGPKSLVWNDLNTNAQRQLVRTAVHEILHALGFSSSFWSTHFPNGNPVTSETRRGKTVKYFSSTKVVEKAKVQFECPTLNGPEIEDEGGTGTGGSHWNRRNHKDDIMAGLANRGSYLSHITLGVLEDSGHYTIDWSKAEDPKWMYKGGCKMFTKKCITVAGGLRKYFCNDGLEACTPDHRSYGTCDIGTFPLPLPSWARYFPGEPNKGGTAELMDYCPIVGSYGNRQCDNPANIDGNETTIPEYFANDGRCFNTDGVIRVYSNNDLGNANCLQTRCVSNAVEFKMPNNAAWIPCPSKGAHVTLLRYGYKGTVTCPDPNMICDGVEINAPIATIPTATTPTTPAPANIPPTETTPTTPATATTPTTPATATPPTASPTTTTLNAKSSNSTAKSATTISSTIPAVLITSVVLLYLSRLVTCVLA